jgi:general secretion pathway protein K
MSAAPRATPSRRRGVALLAALWLVVAIATVGLQFGLEAREHRRLAIGAAERGQARAAAAGAAALTRARLERALRQPAVRGQAALSARASDPWLDADSLFSGVDTLGGVVVEVRARDLGERLNVNQLGDDELRTFLGFVLDDYMAADELAQAIMDWRDPDDLARPRGAEREAYERRGRLALPANGPFREVEELLQVEGMTPERFAKVRPYLATRGTGVVNLNSADEPVLRALPGMTDAMVARLLGMRSQGQRLRSVNELVPGAAGRPAPGRPAPGRPRRPGAAGSEVVRRLQQRAAVDVREVELTLIARAGPQALPVRVQAVVQRGGGATTTIGWQTWQ